MMIGISENAALCEFYRTKRIPHSRRWRYEASKQGVVVIVTSRSASWVATRTGRQDTAFTFTKQ